MFLVKLITEPAILIIIATFVVFILFVVKSYGNVQANLQSVVNYLRSFNKNELSYKFKQLDEFMSGNNYTNTIWSDFKQALLFPEKLYIASQTQLQSGEGRADIYLTVDASYFFNEETLVLSKINHKFIQTIPTLLTGLGPFFTFLKMAIAFSGINFTSADNIGCSLDGLMANIQIAALCSVFAVGFSLLFMFTEKLMYQKFCKKYYLDIQKEFIRLFDIVTSEKFLIDLLKESKTQNLSNEKLLKAIPENFASLISKSLGETTTPYLENILYSLNKLNETLTKQNNGDVVDKLF